SLCFVCWYAFKCSAFSSLYRLRYSFRCSAFFCCHFFAAAFRRVAFFSFHLCCGVTVALLSWCLQSIIQYYSTFATGLLYRLYKGNQHVRGKRPVEPALVREKLDEHSPIKARHHCASTMPIRLFD